MDWFEQITGFREASYQETLARLSVVDGRLVRTGAGHSYAVGTLSLPSLAELRAAAAAITLPGRLRLSIAEGDVRAMHRAPENCGALFQVASQFNLLEMPGFDVTPGDGVTGYAHDHTQGPACAMAAGAATIYRNYLVPVGDGVGQTADRQLDVLADLGAALTERLGTEIGTLWTMRNGYALPTREGLARIGAYLEAANAAELDVLRGLLRIGLHADVEVTDGPALGLLVNQVFASALPVAYGHRPAAAWAPFARLVLEAAYEATLLVGVLNAARGASNRVLLTRLGGGAFGNDDAWIHEAMLRALRLVSKRELAVVVVSYRSPSQELRDLVQASGFAAVE